jgi:hypothetical protein
MPTDAYQGGRAGAPAALRMPEQGRHPAFWQSAERSEQTTYSCLGKHLGLEESSSVLEFIAVEADYVRIAIVVTLWDASGSVIPLRRSLDRGRHGSRRRWIDRAIA